MRKYMYLLTPMFIIAILFTLVLPNNQGPKNNMEIKVAQQYVDPFPIPTKKIGKFYTVYSSNDIQYSISPLQINMTNDPVHGGNTFEIDYYNSVQNNISPDEELKKHLDIGCVATNDGQYKTIKDDQSMFGPKISKMPANSGLSFDTFLSWQHQKVVIEVQPNCKYIGTADLQYSWLVK